MSKIRPFKRRDGRNVDKEKPRLLTGAGVGPGELWLKVAWGHHFDQLGDDHTGRC
jgi:hypothetical protein